MVVKNPDTRQRWYYDACVLDHEKSYHEIVNKNDLRINYVSHLSIGEAYGNCLRKGKDENQAAAFINLINTVKKYINIIGNDGRSEYFNKVRTKFSHLDLCDTVHLSTAISYSCDILLTNDCHLSGLDAKEIKELSEELSGKKLIIKKI